MNYEDSLKYLYGLGHETLMMNLDLDNTRKILKQLKNPEAEYKKIQVAGTNGKGSVCTYVGEICITSGIRTGVYTSPDIVSITERIKINGSEILPEEFAKNCTMVRDVCEELLASGQLFEMPTFFEQVTAICFNAFAEAKIELAILETGLGGRFDSTTAANAELAVITPIDFDHQQYLGNTISEIAGEKAAIIHKGSHVVSSLQRPEAMEVILRQCKQFGIVPEFSDPQIEVNEVFKYGYLSVNIATKKDTYSNIRLQMLGRHQIDNAALAIITVELLPELGWKIPKTSIIEGLEAATHRGRLEYRNEILFDGAHNIAGAEALKKYLDEFVEKPVTIIFGAMKDKDLFSFAKVLFGRATYLILTTLNNPRAASIEDLLKLVPAEFPKHNVFSVQNAGEAVEKAKTISENGLICVTGSLYLVGEIQKLLKATRHGDQ
jgi:dihydrofolate synthase/folylpolyglutamate synthase